jgi:NAD(P)-dependent dehydrogenase (short-subunit alcohol dehydrogenase family)
LESAILDGQVALVTGASRGIGREIARALAMNGAKVAVTARNAEMLEETVMIITDAGGECAAFVMDVTDYDAITEVVTAITEKYGAIDLLVNNAGIGMGGLPPWETDIDAWWKIQEVNLKGVFMVSHAVMPSMIEHRKGRVINVGSYVGTYPSPTSSAYSVSKAALVRLTDSTAVAAQEYGVSVFVISPGLVYTDMTKDAPPFQDLPASAWVPIERSGELCVALASGKADKLTGRFIHANADDLDDLIARADEIIENDLYTLTLKK